MPFGRPENYIDPNVEALKKHKNRLTERLELIMNAVEWIARAGETGDAHAAIQGFLLDMESVDIAEFVERRRRRNSDAHVIGGRKGGLEAQRRRRAEIMAILEKTRVQPE